MKNLDFGVRQSLLTASLILLLSLWASLPFYLERLDGLAGPTLGTISTWEVLVLIVPIAGIAAAVYGWFYKNIVSAFLVGVVPYAPLIFFGIPAVLFLGAPMGMIGAGTSFVSKREIRPGILVIIAGILSWGLSTLLILRGFR